MGLRDKKRNQRRVLSRRSAGPKTGEGKDFLPLEGKEQRVREKKQPEEPESTATVLYIGHIPHGFYEDQMQGFFQQFGAVKRVRVARNRKVSFTASQGIRYLCVCFLQPSDLLFGDVFRQGSPSIMDSLSLRTLRWRRLWLMR
uniref:RRM domain-containing protein n=1 Tax=Aegilops tauschii subsp. strangulata TaxID=200361 RepID=A0A453MQ04_AEGTS